MIRIAVNLLLVISLLFFSGCKDQCGTPVPNQESAESEPSLDLGIILPGEEYPTLFQQAEMIRVHGIPMTSKHKLTIAVQTWTTKKIDEMEASTCMPGLYRPPGWTFVADSSLSYTRVTVPNQKYKQTGTFTYPVGFSLLQPNKFLPPEQHTTKYRLEMISGRSDVRWLEPESKAYPYKYVGLGHAKGSNPEIKDGQWIWLETMTVGATYKVEMLARRDLLGENEKTFTRGKEVVFVNGYGMPLDAPINKESR